MSRYSLAVLAALLAALLHVALDPVWAQAQDAGIPIVLHVGGGGRLLDPAFFENGLPPVPDFHGGDGNFRSVDYMAICYPPMQTLAVLIIDGVLDRFADLKVGAIELGASWVPGWMRNMDSAADAFRKNEERLQKLELKPSEYVRRQIRVTPYPHEDAGWCIANSGEEVCLFSTDYPHVEGGRNPLGRFERSLENTPESAKQAFYYDNFVDLMGSALNKVTAPACRPTGVRSSTGRIPFRAPTEAAPATSPRTPWPLLNALWSLATGTWRPTPISRLTACCSPSTITCSTG